ncbi:hypothetical protein BBJ28_00016588 [Nothophytophthora sp. Chile5]|nr:hypothetical protein BBJ28_00016588 [Nothophytophthora sp. Chile5]
MKSFTAAIAAAATLISIVSAASDASYADCSSAVLSDLLTDQYIDQCATDSGYVFTAASIPTQSVIDLMCASTACQDLLADVEAMGLSECIIPVGDDILLFADLVDYVPAHCPSSSSGSTTSSSSTSTATTAPTTTTTAPSTTTTAPTATTTTTTTTTDSPTAC